MNFIFYLVYLIAKEFKKSIIVYSMNNYWFEVHKTTLNKTLLTFGTKK